MKYQYLLHIPQFVRGRCRGADNPQDHLSPPSPDTELSMERFLQQQEWRPPPKCEDSTRGFVVHGVRKRLAQERIGSDVRKIGWIELIRMKSVCFNKTYSYLNCAYMYWLRRYHAYVK